MAKRIGIKIELLDSDENVIAEVYRGEANAIPKEPQRLPMKIVTGNLEPGYYGLLATFWETETGAIITSKYYPEALHILEKETIPEPVPRPEFPDESILGTPVLSAPSELDLGDTWVGQITVPNTALISYPIGRRVYLEKGGEGTVVLSEAAVLKPGEIMNISFRFDTSVIKEGEGTYKVYLQLWDAAGDTFFRSSIGNLFLKKAYLEFPDESILGTPVLSAPSELDLGDTWVGQITVPNTALISYPIGRQVYLEKDGEETVILSEAAVLKPGEIMNISFRFDTSVIKEGEGTYKVYLQLWDAAGDTFFRSSIGNLFLKEVVNVPDISFLGEPKINAPGELEIGKKWSGTVFMPTIPVVSKSLYFNSRVWLEGSVYEVATKGEEIKLGNDITIPFSFDTSGMNPGSYNIFLEVSDQFNNLINNFALGILKLGAMIPSSLASIGFESIILEMPDTIELENTTTWEGTLGISIPSLINLGFFGESSYELTLVTELRPRWIPEGHKLAMWWHVHGIALSTAFIPGQKSKKEIKFSLNTGQTSMVPLAYRFDGYYGEKVLFEVVDYTTSPLTYANEADCDVWITLKDGSGNILFEDVVGVLKLFRLSVDTLPTFRLGKPSISFNPAIVEMGGTSTGSISIPSAVDFPMTLQVAAKLGEYEVYSPAEIKLEPAGTKNIEIPVDTSGLPTGIYDLQLNITNPLTGDLILNKVFNDVLQIIMPPSLKGVNEISNAKIFYVSGEKSIPEIDMGFMVEAFRLFGSQPGFPIAVNTEDKFGALILFTHIGEGGNFKAGIGVASKKTIGHNRPSRYYSASLFMDAALGAHNTVLPHAIPTPVVAVILNTWPISMGSGTYDAQKYIIDPSGKTLWEDWDDDIFNVS